MQAALRQSNRQRLKEVDGQARKSLVGGRQSVRQKSENSEDGESKKLGPDGSDDLSGSQGTRHASYKAAKNVVVRCPGPTLEL